MNNALNFAHQPYFHTMGPMMIVTVTAFVVMILEFSVRRMPRRILTSLAMLGTLCALGVAIRFDAALIHGTWLKPVLALNTVAVEPIGSTFSILILIGTFLVLLFSLDYEQRTPVATEHSYLLLFGVVGALTMATAFDLVSLYIGLELLSIASYVLVALKRKSSKSIEGGAKYLIMGSIGSATLLYGLSYIYGISGSTDILVIGQNARTLWSTYPTIIVLAFVFIVAGMGVKLSLVPFHMWTPDAYEGAPSPISSFLATVSKVAGFILLLRLVLYIFGEASFNTFYWIGILAAVTMVVGNLLALPQRNMKRLLAFSSVAQAGYVLVPYALLAHAGVAQDWYGLIDAITFYLLVYTFMTIGAFAVVHIVGQHQGTGEDEALLGLAKTNPWLAGALTVFLLSLAGMPLTGGFIGKFYIITETIHTRDLWLGIVLFGASVMSFFYYFGWIRKLYQRPIPTASYVPRPDAVTTAGVGTPVAAGSGAGSAAPTLVASPVMHSLLIICVIGTLLLGIAPAVFLHPLLLTTWF